MDNKNHKAVITQKKEKKKLQIQSVFYFYYPS